MKPGRGSAVEEGVQPPPHVVNIFEVKGHFRGNVFFWRENALLKIFEKHLVQSIGVPFLLGHFLSFFFSKYVDQVLNFL